MSKDNRIACINTAMIYTGREDQFIDRFCEGKFRMFFQLTRSSDAWIREHSFNKPASRVPALLPSHPIFSFSLSCAANLSVTIMFPVLIESRAANAVAKLHHVIHCYATSH